MTPEKIAALIQENLAGSHATVEGDGRHFDARVVCDAFEGKRELARHRMVYAALGDNMDEAIHALSLTTLTPAEAGS